LQNNSLQNASKYSRLKFAEDDLQLKHVVQYKFSNQICTRRRNRKDNDIFELKRWEQNQYSLLLQQTGEGI